MNFRKKNVLIFGYGKSGKSALNLLKNLCENIYVYDKKFNVTLCDNFEKNNSNFINKIPQKKYKLNKNKLKNNKINNNLIKNNYFCDFFNKDINYFNNIDDILINKIHFCIVSPGVDLDCEEIKKIKKLNIKILSELELGGMFCKGKIFAITGTNGKTTTVNLLYQIFKNAGKHAFLCGNVGVPISAIAKKTNKNSLIVCEVSSFQLESSHNFKPYASCILNLEEDHLNRHKTLENYGFIKNKINNYYKTKKIFNIDDNNLINFSNKYQNSINFSIKNNKLNNLIKNNKLIGEFNKQNLICACIMAKLENIDDEIIAKTIENFEGLPHRLKLVAKHKNITYINDSKSTNILSTKVALDAVGENVILLLGGSEKNLDFGEIFEGRKITTTIAFGETKTKIASACKNSNLIICEKFADAVKKSFEIAKENQVVLLSPACASFDEFTSYEQRGELFEKMVNDFISKDNV